jgi:hypothetical protein
MEEQLLPTFYESLLQMGKVDRLYRINLSSSMNILSPVLILEKVKALVGDRTVLKFISSFLSLPIVDSDDGSELSEIKGLVRLGLFSMVLLNIVLMDIFDREFSLRYPGIVFARHLSEVYISVPFHEKVLFDEDEGYKFLSDVGLAGVISTIRPGDTPVWCFNRKVSLDSAGQVQLVVNRLIGPITGEPIQDLPLIPR